MLIMLQAPKETLFFFQSRGIPSEKGCTSLPLDTSAQWLFPNRPAGGDKDQALAWHDQRWSSGGTPGKKQRLNLCSGVPALSGMALPSQDSRLINSRSMLASFSVGASSSTPTPRYLGKTLYCLSSPCSQLWLKRQNEGEHLPPA